MERSCLILKKHCLAEVMSHWKDMSSVFDKYNVHRAISSRKGIPWKDALMLSMYISWPLVIL